MLVSSQTLTENLQQLQTSHALQLVAVVGLDGMVLDAASDGLLDVEMIAAVAAPGLLMMSELAAELGEGLARVTTLEYERHVAVLMPLDDETLFIAVAEPGTINLGQLRVILRRSMADLRSALDTM